MSIEKTYRVESTRDLETNYSVGNTEKQATALALKNLRAGFTKVTIIREAASRLTILILLFLSSCYTSKTIITDYDAVKLESPVVIGPKNGSSVLMTDKAERLIIVARGHECFTEVSEYQEGDTLPQSMLKCFERPKRRGVAR